MLKPQFLLTGAVLVSLALNLLSALMPAAPALAQAEGWTAYNDCSGTTGGNTTAYTLSGATTGLLRNYVTGADMSVAVTFTSSGNPTLTTGEGAATNSGTDAANTFNGFANMTGVINYGSSSGWSVTMTFTGLDPAKTYTFATTANRNNSDYTTRVSRFTISDITGATNASTTGVTVISNESVAFSTGYNTITGYVARWTDIQPGPDGDFIITTVGNASPYRAYGPSVFLLQEEPGAPTNHAPQQPVLIQPPDEAIGISTSPTLEVIASDPDAADTLTVSFYGRAANVPAEPDFTLVAFPDIQNQTQYAPAMLNSQVNWIVANRISRNIVFATTMGDTVNASNSTTEYGTADAAMDVLDAGDVWYTVAPGNHDNPGYYLPLRYPDYFSPLRYANHLYANGYWFGGSYDNYNTYSLFSASGNDFILINLQFNPSTAILNWADALLKANPNRRGIVEQHDILNTDNSWNNQASYNALRDNPNLFLMLCGHMHTPSDGAAYRAEPGEDGHTIHIVMQDYQDMSYGNGYLRLYRFSPANDTIYMTTYSPYTGGSLTTSPNQMNLAYDLAGSEPPYEIIGTVTGVATGSSASLAWPGRLPNTEYEWYAVASDGVLSTTSPVWNFTTGSEIQWGSFDSAGSTAVGVYDTDNTTILQTGDLAQLIWAGSNNLIDPPQCGGAPGGDDQLLDTATIQNAGSLPPAAQNRGYVPLKTYSFGAGAPWDNGVIYVRAWNAGTTISATAYGHSAPGTLIEGTTYNAARWYTNHGFTTATWNGPTGGSWQTAGNWSTGSVPDCRTYVVLPEAASVQLGANAASRGLTVANSAVLNLNTFNVTVEDTLVNIGTLTQIRNAPGGSTTEFLHLCNAAGTVDKYHGVDITPASSMGATAVTLKGNQAQCTGNLTDALIARCFNITPGAAANATLRFWYTEAERNNQAANNLRLWHYNPRLQVGAPYTYSESGITCASEGGTACWIQAVNVTSYSPFGVGSGAEPTAITLRTLTTRVESIVWLPLGAICIGVIAVIVVRKRRG